MHEKYFFIKSEHTTVFYRYLYLYLVSSSNYNKVCFVLAIINCIDRDDLATANFLHNIFSEIFVTKDFENACHEF